MSVQEMIGFITFSLTASGAIVALTRYITQLQFQVRLERLEVERSKAEAVVSELTATNKHLLEELTIARRAGAAASSKRAEIDQELHSLMKLTSAEAGSVYLPLQNQYTSEASGLVFAAIQPITEHTMKLRKKIIPLHSLAGRCYTEARSVVVANAKSSQDHYDKADEVSGYRTQDALNVPLRSGKKVVGVLQLLNKRGGSKFSDNELAEVEQQSSRIALKVEEFSTLPGNLELLGFVPEVESQNATIMFCDLTASSRLFQELNTSAAVQHINEYLEELCDVAFGKGATVDKYMGDGVLFRFNVPHPVDDHPMAAIRAAIDIQTAFDKIKKDWLTMGEVLSDLYTRSGLAYGPVQKVTVGHPQYQYLTVFGIAVNSSVNLCESAPRDKNVIVIDENMYQQVLGRVAVKPIPHDRLGKAASYTANAYEVVGIL